MAKPERTGLYAEGYRAFARSPLEECPHRYQSNEYCIWRMGWWAANEQYLKDPDAFTGEP